MQRRLLNPKIDFVFKKIFGSEENPKILIGFLNAVLKPIIPIVEVEIKNTDIEKVMTGNYKKGDITKMKLLILKYS